MSDEEYETLDAELGRLLAMENLSDVDKARLEELSDLIESEDTVRYGNGI